MLDPEEQRRQAAHKVVHALYAEIEPLYRSAGYKLNSAESGSLAIALASRDLDRLRERRMSINPIESAIADRILDELLKK